VIVRYSAVFPPNPSRIGVLSWCSFICVVFGSGVMLGVIYYYIIHYYILYIYYYILYYTLLLLYIIIHILLYYTLLFYLFLFCSSPLLFPILSRSSPPIFILYLSVLTYTYLYSLQIFPIFHSSPNPSQTRYPSLKGIYLSINIKRNTIFYLWVKEIHISIYHFILYLSVLTYGYLYSSSVPDLSNNLTPHVLSEWMVEVCRFEVYWNPV
jgi:hypothetical protein